MNLTDKQIGWAKGTLLVQDYETLKNKIEYQIESITEELERLKTSKMKKEMLLIETEKLGYTLRILKWLLTDFNL